MMPEPLLILSDWKTWKDVYGYWRVSYCSSWAINTMMSTLHHIDSAIDSQTQNVLDAMSSVILAPPEDKILYISR